MSTTINFSTFSVQKSANERTSLAGVSRGQNFKMKFRKYNSKKNQVIAIETGYTIANDKWAELDLDNHGIVQLEGTQYIAIVSNDDATMLKRTDKLKEGSEKGRKFKSTILDKTLIEKGIVEDKEGITQFLDLVKVADATTLGEGEKAVQAVAIYEIVKAEDTRDEAEKASEDSATEAGTPETELTPGSVAETPAQEEDDTF